MAVAVATVAVANNASATLSTPPPSLSARPYAVFNGFECINFNNQLWYREIGSLTSWNMYDDSL